MPSKRSNQDKTPSSPEFEYSPEELSYKYDLSIGEAAALIKRYGPSRSKLDAIMGQRLRG